ncbi:3-keto-disaccharide hydrolase [Gramella jeungdoensis]|nr:DUF1080 domain-containing protein [Gramella jeungdoensis]
MKKILLSLVSIGLLFGCKTEKDNSNEKSEGLPKAETEAVKNSEEDWIYLLDGKNADGWRAYNGEAGLPEGWVVENESLKALGKGGDIGGDIIYGKEKYGEFELYLEWKIAPEGNSGIFYHVVEGEQYEAPYFNAPEYQVIDQLGFPRRLEELNSLGADYGMYAPDYKEEDIKKAGEWNTTRIIFTNDKVSYWLNGQKTVEFVPWSDDWEKRKSEGKWKEFPDYGKAREGFIGLQDHGSEVWYRNIKIKKL